MPKYNYFTLLFILGFFLTNGLGAQPTPREASGERFEKIRLARQEFITAELQLTPEESERFFAVFWEYDAQFHRLRKQQYRSHTHRDEAAGKPQAALSEAEAKKILENRLQTEAKLLELKRQAMAKYMELLPATKLVLLDKAEHTFRKQLVRRVHQERKED